MPISSSARITRMAISPRFATKTLPNTRPRSLAGADVHVRTRTSPLIHRQRRAEVAHDAAVGRVVQHPPIAASVFSGRGGRTSRYPSYDTGRWTFTCAAESACARHGFIERKNPTFETVVRPGSGGKRQYPGLVVYRSLTLEGQTGRKDGIPVVSPERALIDVAPRLTDLHLGRGFREACRLKCTTADAIALQLKGQRGTAFLNALCDRYASVPYHRCRSDPECRGLEVLHDAGIPLPSVNMRVAGREADYVWRQWKLIIEVDSKEFHPFSIDDRDKQELWEAAGYTVKRIWANDIYHRPHMLLALV